MNHKDIEKIKNLSNEIGNFNDCYKDCVLWGSSPDGDVAPERVLEWLINNPHMAEIAYKIHNLNK